MAKKLYNSCLASGIIDEVRTRHIISYLVKNKPRNYFAILNRLKNLISLKLAESSALVESAQPLGAEEQVITAKLQQRYGSHVSVKFALNPDLLAGLRITLGSQVWDGSVQTRLKNLQNSFN